MTEGDNGSANLTFTVTLSPASGRQVTVQYADARSGTATSGTDYTALTGGTLTFAAGDTGKTVTVSVTGDTTDEPNETVAVVLSSPTNATVSSTAGTGTGTITDDDDAPTVTLALSRASIAESGTTNSATVTASLDRASSAETTVTVSAAAGTNAVPGDFSLSGSMTLTIAAGSTSSTGTVTVTAVDNTADEPDKSVTVSGSASNTQGITQPSAVTLAITDDDGAPTLSIGSVSVAEGDSGAANLTFTVSLSPASGREVTVGYADAGTGTATSGTDYTALTSGSLTFAAGDTSKTVTVSVTGDTTDEPNETVVVSLSSPVNATVAAGSASGTGTITDDDDAPTVTLALSRASIAESGTTNSATVTASLDRASSAATTVTVAAAAGTNAVPGDFSLSSSTTLTIAAGSTSSTGVVTVTAVNNTADESDKSVTVSATATNTQGITQPASVTLTITDDDGAPTLSIGSASVAEGDSGSANLTFTVTLNPASGRQVTVQYADAGSGTATSGTDYTALTSGTLTFAAGDTSKTVGVAVTGDTEDEPNETVIVTLSNPVNATVAAGSASGTGTITDDDAAPKVTLALSRTSITESGTTNSTTVTASLDRASSAATTITVSATAGTDTVSGDFSLSSNKTLTIAAGSTDSTGVVTVTAVDNTADEPDKNVTVSGSAANSQGITQPSAVTLAITDDDGAPTLSIDSPSVNEGDSGSASLTFTVTLSPASGRQVTVGYSDTGTGSATSGTDYTALSGGTLTFAAGDTSKTVTVSVTGDTTDEPNETVLVALSGAANAAVSSTAGTGTGTITDDDDTPTVTLALSRSSIAESGSTNSTTVTASLDRASSAATTITVSAAAGTDTVAGDFSLSGSTTLTIAAGSTSSTGAVTVTAVDNSADEPDKSVTVSATATNTQGITQPSAVTLAITDDDGAPTLSIGPTSVTEGDSGSADLTFTVTLSPASGREVTVGYADDGTGTATTGEDYTALTGGTLTFAAGDTSKTVTVSVTGDTTDEPNETVVVTLSSPVNATVSSTAESGTGTITDDDATPTVTLALSPTSIAESGSANASTVTASLDHPSSAATTITVGATAGTNAGSGDFSLSSQKTLTIAAGATTSIGTVTITAVDDTKDGLDKSVTVSGSATNTQGITNPSDVTLTITDDDGAPTLSIGSASVTEGDSGAATLTFTVSLSAASARQVTVDYADAGTGTATSGTDYTAITDGTLTFAAGDTSETISVLVTGDTTDEPDETVEVTLSGATNATISTATGTGTITDDDDAPTVTLALSRTSVTESGANNSTTVTASLDRPSSAATTITVSAAAGTDTVAGDFSLSSSTTLTIAAGSTSSTGAVTVTAVDNPADESDKSVMVSGSATNTQGITNPSAVTLTITDDDGAPTLSIGSASVAEGDSGAANLTFTVSLSPASGREVTVGYADAGTGTATSGTDYTALTSGSLTFAAGDTSKTVTVSVTGDTTDEPNETVLVALSSPTNATVSSTAGTGTGTITDDDDAPTVTLALSRASIAESGTTNSATVTASLDRASSAETTVTVSAAAGTDAVSGDFSLSGNKTLTIAAGSTSSTGVVTVTAVDNTRDEPDKSVTVSGSAANSQGITPPSAVTLTITDDDGSPTLSIGSASVAEGDSGSANLTFTVTLNPASGRQVTVQYADAGSGTATSGTDYTALTSGTLTFAAGDTSKTVTVSVTGDTTDEPNETVLVALSSATNAALSSTAGTGTGTITDDDDAPTVTLALSRTSVTESGANNSTTVTASLDRPSSTATTITVSAAAGTDTVADDFSLSSSKTLTIAAGNTGSTGAVTVTAVDNTRDEPDKSVTVSGSAANSQGITQPSSVTLAITDDDGAPTLSIDSPSVAEGAVGETSTLRFTVTLSPASGQQVTVGYADDGTGTATAGEDYAVLAAGTLTFAAGETAQTIDVTVTGDDEDETAETVVVALSSPTNAAVSSTAGTGTGTITDDDDAPALSSDAPTLSIDSPSVAEEAVGETSTLRFTVTLSPASGQQVTVGYADDGTGTATAGEDYAVLAAGTLTFAAGETAQTIDVTVTGDDEDETAETVVVALSSPTNAAVSSTAGTGTGTITDAGAPARSSDAPALSIDSPSEPEGDRGSTNLTFTVTLSPASSQPVTVNYADAGTGTATSGEDYAALPPGTLTFAAGETARTIAVSVTGDTAPEPDETVAVRLSNPSNAVISSAAGTGTGTIANDDAHADSTPVTPLLFEAAVEDRTWVQGRSIQAFELPAARGGRGAVTYALEPVLPPGVERSGFRVSGASAETRDRRTHRWTATDDAGRKAVLFFDVEVVAADRRPVFEYGILDQTYRTGKPIRPLTLPTAAGGDGALRYTLSPTPPEGLTWNARWRTLSGTPLSPQEPMPFTWTATDADGDATRQTFTIEVSPDPAPRFEAEGPALRFRAGRRIEPRALPAAVGGDPPLRYALRPSAPAGLRFDAGSRRLSGTPAGEQAATPYTLVATDADGDEATLDLTIAVDGPAAVLRATLRIVSRPARGDTYGYGEKIALEVVFSEPVTVTGMPELTLTVGARRRPMVFRGGTGSRLRFEYAVAGDDRDDDGVSVAENALTPRDGAIENSTAQSAELHQEHLGDRSGHKVDGSPRAAGSLPPLRLVLGGPPARVDLSGAFAGAETYAAESSVPSVATVSVEGTAAIVTAVVEGTAAVTVRGRNPGGEAAQSFEVTVATAPAEREAVSSALAGLGRSLLAGTSATVGRRLEDGRTGESRLTVAGQSVRLDGGSAVSAADRAAARRQAAARAHRDGSATEDGLSAGSEFALSFGGAGGATAGGGDERAVGSDGRAGARWTVWGAGDAQSFQGGAGSGSTWAGRPATAWVGADVERGHLLAGVAVARTAADLDYTFTEGAAAGNGALSTRLLTVQPYGRWRPDRRTSVWGVGGVGGGAAALSRSVTRTGERADLGLVLGLAGVRRELGSRGGFTLALRGDAGRVRLAASGGGAVLSGLAASAYRTRVGVEVTGAFRGGLSLAPFAAVNSRWDGGADLTGTGLEVAAGLRVADGSGRVEVETRGRLLVTHTAAGYRERGASVTARLTPGGDDRGLQLALAPRWGAAATGADALWQEQAFGPAQAGGGPPAAGALDARVGYGFGLLAPFAEAGWAERQSRRLRLGALVGGIGAPLDIEVTGERHETGDAPPALRFSVLGYVQF